MEMIKDIRKFEKCVRSGDVDGIQSWIEYLEEKWKLEVKFRNDEIHLEKDIKDFLNS